MTQDTLQASEAPAQGSFLFSTAPATRKDPADIPKSEKAPASPEAKQAPGGLSTQLIIVITTGIVGLVTGLGTLWFNHYHEAENARAQAGQRLRKEILDKSTDVTLALRATRKILVNDGFEAAVSSRVPYDKAVRLWYKSRADLLDRAQTGFGPSFALLIDAPSGRNIVTDRCGVVVRRDDPARGKDCTARLEREVALLTARQDAVNAERPALVAEGKVLIPGDFTSSLRIANTLVDRVSDCKKSYKGPAAKLHAPVATRCPNLRTLQFALNLRVNLLGIRQDEIAKALHAQ
ncbi:MAG: hypothetical protein BGP00_00025 [Novosphingobium sp. 63-713]|nr:MAG: hypothetical protein BGP00_00025 [Novosphingobium sp. 63-713]